MTIENNSHGITSLVSNTLKTNRVTKTVAGLMIGGMIAAASLLPGNTLADTPARPVGVSATANFMDMDLLDPGFYDAKLVLSSSASSVFDMDLLDPGFYDAKLARISRVWKSPGFDPYEDVASKLVRTSNTANVTDMNLLDPGFYDAKLARTGASPSWAGLQEDNII